MSLRCLLPTFSFWRMSFPGLGMVLYWWKWARTRLTEQVERFRHMPIHLWLRNFASLTMAHCISGMVCWPCGMATTLVEPLDEGAQKKTYCRIKSWNTEISKPWIFDFGQAVTWMVWVDWCHHRQIPSGHWEDMGDRSGSVFLDVIFPWWQVAWNRQ